MKYDFKNSYMSINDKIEINIDMTRFKWNLAKAQQNLAYQIISDTQDYVPFQQGILSNSAHTENDDSEIVYNTPYARFLYMGKLMLDDRGSSWALQNTRKHVVNKDLEFSKEAHSKAGAKWYERSKEDNLQNWIKTVKRSFK